MAVKFHSNWIIKGVFTIIALAILSIGVKRLYVIVQPGNVGVYEIFGKVYDNEYHPGFHLKNPFAKITQMNTRTQAYTMSSVPTEGQRIGDDSIKALTKEGLSIDLDITVLYHIIPDKASDIYKNIGLNYTEIVIRPEIRSTIREAVTQYEVKEIYSEKRAELRDVIYNTLKTNLFNRGIDIEEVLLRNINLPPDLATAIEEKLKAEQEAQRYDFILAAARKEAERKRIEAEGQRDAQKTINESLSSKYLQYMYIQNIGKCTGTIYVPVSPETGLPVFKGIE